MKVKGIITIELSDVWSERDLNDPDNQHALWFHIDRTLENLDSEMVQQADVELIHDGLNKFVAEPNYVEKVFLALEASNPNDSATEDWNDEAVQDLSNYLAANDHDESDLRDMDDLYFLYDMLKWTRANNA